MLGQRIALVNRVGNHLLDLVRPELPKVLSNDAPAYRRALLGLVARATGTMEAILHLAQLRREADLAVLFDRYATTSRRSVGSQQIPQRTTRSGTPKMRANASRRIDNGNSICGQTS